MSKDLDALNQSNEEERKKLAILSQKFLDSAEASDELLKRLRALTKSDPEYNQKLAAIKQEFNALRGGSKKPGNA
jgi:uncharacterized coiled-coil DUF342 family protein